MSPGSTSKVPLARTAPLEHGFSFQICGSGALGGLKGFGGLASMSAAFIRLQFKFKLCARDVK